ncbi:MAG: thioredoxin family protein [Dorea sp.]
MLHLTAKNFQIEVKDTSLPVVVMFYAIWCGKCAMMKPVVEDIEKKYAGKIKFCEVEIEESAVLMPQNTLRKSSRHLFSSKIKRQSVSWVEWWMNTHLNPECWKSCLSPQMYTSRNKIFRNS